MKLDKYVNAVNKLEFSDDLAEKVRGADREKPRFRIVRAAVLAAVMVCMLATTAFAASAEFRNWTISLLKLGVSRQDMADVEVMEFRHDEEVDGVSVHYLELDKDNYLFYHGMLTSPQTGYIRITEDYQLADVEKKIFSASITKNGREYSIYEEYFETDEGIVTSRGYESDLNEMFVVLTDGNSHQWPAYADLTTGTVRDALPDWTEDDFQGRVTYGYELMDGILISTIVNENVIVNGNSEDYNMLYWIGADAAEAVVIDMPADAYGWYCQNGRLYYRDGYGSLYQLNENLSFSLVCSYATGDDLTNGLYTVATENNELAIVDVYSGNTYVLSGYTVDPGSPAGTRERIGGEIDETTGYNATRYGEDGRIALVQTEIDWKNQRVALRKLGILNEQTGEIKLLEIENDYDGYSIRWLDENRLAVIYDGKYLCVYEFTE